jgi:hypothetical protein
MNDADARPPRGEGVGKRDVAAVEADAAAVRPVDASEDL